MLTSIIRKEIQRFEASDHAKTKKTMEIPTKTQEIQANNQADKATQDKVPLAEKAYDKKASTASYSVGHQNKGGCIHQNIQCKINIAVHTGVEIPLEDEICEGVSSG